MHNEGCELPNNRSQNSNKFQFQKIQFSISKFKVGA